MLSSVKYQCIWRNKWLFMNPHNVYTFWVIGQKYCEFYWLVCCKSHCVKSVQIRSFFWFVFSPNTGKYRPEKTPYLDTFNAVSTLKKDIYFWKILIKYVPVCVHLDAKRRTFFYDILQLQDLIIAFSGTIINFFTFTKSRRT